MTKTPHSLSWLIQKHSRLSGILKASDKFPSKIKALKKDLDFLLKDSADIRNCFEWMESAHKDHKKKLLEQIRAVELVLDIHEIRIDPGEIPETDYRPPGSINLPHGALTRGILEYLREHADVASTQDIALFFVLKYGFKLEEDDMVKFRRMLHYRLKNLSAAGKVIGLHNKRSPSLGQWKLPD
jgi:hypothetical protein